MIIRLFKGHKMTTRLSIIDTLESVRKAQGLTQDELAQRAGTSRVTVGRVESGFDPKLATLYELARALGLELVLVPKALAGEVQAFIQSGGRVLAQPSGASAPDSVVSQALAISQAVHKVSEALMEQHQPAHSARSLARQVSNRFADVRSTPPTSVWSARSAAQEGLPFRFAESVNLPIDAFTSSAPKEGSKGPGISAAALARLHGLTPPKGGNR